MLIKIGLRDLSPAMVAWSRVALAAAVLVALAHARGALGGLRGRVGIVALIAVVQVAAPFLLIAAGELEITSSLAGILVSAAPLFTALLAIWVDPRSAPRAASGRRPARPGRGRDAARGRPRRLGRRAARRACDRSRGARIRGRRAAGQAPARRRDADRGRRLGADGGDRDPAPGGDRRRAERAPGPRPGRGGRRARCGRDRDRVRDLLRADRDRRPGPDATSSPTSRPGSRSSTARCCSTRRSASRRSPGWP